MQTSILPIKPITSSPKFSKFANLFPVKSSEELYKNVSFPVEELRKSEAKAVVLANERDTIPVIPAFEDSKTGKSS